MRDDLGFSQSVEWAIASGRLWRAKEILQGRLRNGDFDAATCEQLGVVLLEMGDLLLAGQYLWLSGSPREEYRAAITAFLSRHERRPWEAFVAQFPRSARRTELNQLPAPVLATLREHGFPKNSVHASLNAAAAEEQRRSADNNSCAIPAVVICIVVLLVCLGVFQLGKLVLSLFE